MWCHKLSQFQDPPPPQGMISFWSAPLFRSNYNLKESLLNGNWSQRHGLEYFYLKMLTLWRYVLFILSIKINCNKLHFTFFIKIVIFFFVLFMKKQIQKLPILFLWIIMQLTTKLLFAQNELTGCLDGEWSR